MDSYTTGSKFNDLLESALRNTLTIRAQLVNNNGDDYGVSIDLCWNGNSISYNYLVIPKDPATKLAEKL